MYKKFIPCFYFPTTVGLLDDDPSFSESIQLQLGGRTVVKAFQTPEIALNFFDKMYSLKTFIECWKLDPRPAPYFDSHVRDFDIDVQKIRQTMYDSERFEQIATIVVDYAMPGMNGLDFCSRLQNQPFKKILLTGEVDEKVAVDGFNQGIIDRFIRKDEPDYLVKLSAAILELEQIYFQDLSERVIARLTNNPNFVPYCLDDPAFVTFFNQFLLNYRPAEYYLTGSTGSFICLSFDGTPSWLAVKAESEIQSYYEIAALADKKPSSFVLKGLRDRQLVPYFYEEKDPSEWDTCVHPAEVIKGKTTNYYVAYIDDPNNYAVQNFDQVVSYERFLERLG